MAKSTSQTNKIFRLESRSAIGPAKGPTIAIGIINAKTDAPTHVPDSVISYIMKGDAIPCNQPPLLEAKPANQNRRKSRIRNAEIASDNFGRDRF